MSVLQLDFESLEGKIYGREKELQTLKETWERVETGSHEIVLVSGAAGSGKTTLIQHSLQDTCSSLVVGTAKFDQQQQPPFAELTTALTQVLEQVLLEHDEAAETLKERLEANKLVSLFPILPSLSKLVTAPEASPDSSPRAIENSLIYLLREIPSPVLLFLDDLQFADEATMDLLVALADDHACSLVFCYRDGVCSGDGTTHPWSSRLSKFKTSAALHLQLKDLDIASIGELLADLMSRQDCQELTSLIYDKTGGNIFYTLQLLQVLQTKSLLYYDVSSSFRWKWKANEIREECALSDNVVKLVIGRLEALKEETMQVLQAASCLGSRFDTAALTGTLQRSVEASLQEAARERLIEETQQRRVYKWAHDRIQEAAYATIRDHSGMHWRIGHAMKSQLKSGQDSDSTTTLAVVDQLDRGRQHMKANDSLWLVKWNIRAAHTAIGMSAFFPALEFINAGIDILGEDGWSTEYDAMLELSALAARVHFNVGQNEECLREVKRLHSHVKSIEDELPVYPVEIKAIFNTNVDESICRGLEILQKITGKKFPRRPSAVATLRYLRRIERRLASIGVAALPDLPDCTETNLIVASEIMAALFICCWLTCENTLLGFLCFRSIEFALDYGLVSAYPFALYCITKGGLGQYGTAYELAEVTLKLIKRCPLADQARTLACVRSYGLTLRRPLHEQIDHILSAYRTEMDAGEVIWSGGAATTYVHFSFFAGRPLDSLKDDALEFHREMIKYGLGETFGDYIAPCTQVVVNLTSTEGNPAILEGNLVQPEHYLNLPKQKRAIIEGFHAMRLILALHFMDLDSCEEIVEDFSYKSAKHSTHITIINRRFYYGLAAFVLARRRKRKYYRRGRQMAEELRKLVQFGNMNCAHLLLVLRAEETAANKSCCHDDVKNAYDKAISTCSRSGFIPYAALASQLAGLYFLEEDSEEGMRYLESSIEMYEKWNARALVGHLRNKHGIYSRGLTRGRSSLFMSRHSCLLTEKHRQRPTLLLGDSFGSCELSPED